MAWFALEKLTSANFSDEYSTADRELSTHCDFRRASLNGPTLKCTVIHIHRVGGGGNSPAIFGVEHDQIRICANFNRSFAGIQVEAYCNIRTCDTDHRAEVHFSTADSIRVKQPNSIFERRNAIWNSSEVLATHLLLRCKIKWRVISCDRINFPFLQCLPQDCLIASIAQRGRHHKFRTFEVRSLGIDLGKCQVLNERFDVDSHAASPRVKRTLKRLDLMAKSLFAILEPGSAFVGCLFEMALASDRSFMKAGDEQAFIGLSAMNFGPAPMSNGLTRLATRFLHAPAKVEELASVREFLDSEQALEHGLVTFTPDEIDWDDEVRIAIEERVSLSPDALTGMEANLRFAGPETMETKIFARLSAWQNWIFQRPNAVGERGALTMYGRPERPEFDWRRT